VESTYLTTTAKAPAGCQRYKGESTATETAKTPAGRIHFNIVQGTLALFT
jgi:hypothetical protein